MLEMLLGVGGKGVGIRKASLPNRRAVIADTIAGKLYVFGGSGPSGDILGDLLCYTPETDSWETKASGPPSRYNHVAGVVNGKLYIHGGYNGALGGVLKDTWCYDPTDNTWVQKTSAPAGRSGAGGVGSGTRLVVLGGNVAGNWDKTIWAYRANNNDWVQLAPFPGVARQNPSLAAIGDKVYCYSGFDSTGARINDFWQYDVTLNTWVQFAPSPAGGRYLHKAFTFNNKMYVHGGWSAAGPTGELLCYDPAGNSWTKSATDQKMYDHFAVPINSKLYLGGGYLSTGELTGNMWELELV